MCPESPDNVQVWVLITLILTDLQPLLIWFINFSLHPTQPAYCCQNHLPEMIPGSHVLFNSTNGFSVLSERSLNAQPSRSLLRFNFISYFFWLCSTQSLWFDLPSSELIQLSCLYLPNCSCYKLFGVEATCLHKLLKWLPAWKAPGPHLRLFISTLQDS